MTEPTNLVKTQPDETAIYTVEANGNYGHKDFLNSVLGDGNIKLSATTSCHIGITIKPDKDIPSWHVWSWILYKDDAGAWNFANSSKISYVIPAGVWTRLEWTVAVPAGMTVTWTAISIDRLSDETKFQVTNFVVYPLTGGRIVRARGTTALVSVSDGAKGADGVSPTVSVSKTGSTTTISITDKNGTHTQTVLDGVNGTPGAKGADGKTPYFHVKYSNDGGKTFTANGGETAGTYIGTCTDYNSADPTSVGSYTWAKIKGDTGATGPQGPKGATGTGVSAIVEQYYLSTSSTTQTGGSWSTTSPAWQSGHYIWTRSQITWTTGTITYTTPVLAQAINSANQTANTALSSANGKGKNYYQTAQPSSGKDGDLWFKLDSSGNAIGIYKYNGKAWVAMPIESSVIASLEAAKITSGSFTGKEFTGGTFTGSRFTGSTFKTHWAKVTVGDYADAVGAYYARVRLYKNQFLIESYQGYGNKVPTDDTLPDGVISLYGAASWDTDNIIIGYAAKTASGGITDDEVDDILTNDEVDTDYLISKKMLGTMVYRVGTIYMSTENYSPAVFFGGTWEQIKDRFLLSAGNSYSAGSTGGQTNMHIRNCGSEASGYGLTPSLGFENRVMVTDGNNYTSDTNLPPYLTVYMWKRIA